MLPTKTGLYKKLVLTKSFEQLVLKYFFAKMFSIAKMAISCEALSSFPWDSNLYYKVQRHTRGTKILEAYPTVMSGLCPTAGDQV